MHTSRYVPHTAALGAAGGTLWIAAGLLGGASGRWPVGAGVLVIAALPLLLATLLGIASHLRARHGVSVRTVQGLAWAGTGLAVIARAVDLLVDSAAVAPLFGTGTFLLSAALLLLGSAVLRTSSGAGWEGVLLLVGLIGLFLPVGAGVAGAAGLAAWMVWGTGWLAIGNVLWQVYLAARPHNHTVREATLD